MSLRGPSRGNVWSLSCAHDAGQLVRIRCAHCNIVRLFLPSDLKQLLGNVGTQGIERRMRCDTCGKGEYMMASFERLTAAERQGKPIRRLVTIQTIRRPVWRDDWS